VPSTSSHLDYPRPQLRRAAHTNLDGAWGFAVDTSHQGLRDHWFGGADAFTRQIMVPFPPESPASGIGEDVDAPLWYRREFEYVPLDGHRLLLHFEGVDFEASVWVNGMHVGDHIGSQTRFSFDVTDSSHAGDNVVVVRAVDTRSLEQPRGKQDWKPEPHAIWYRRTSGIWRTVWLEQVPDTRLDTLVLTPDADLASVRLEARLAGPADGAIRLELEFRRDGRLLSSTSHEFISSVVRGRSELVYPGVGVEPESLWWTPESPVLIDVTARLVRDGAVLDTVASYVGLRSVSTDAQRVLLNGRRYFLRLVLEQGYWPESHLAAPSFSALEREAELIKELGFNGIRMHQTSADPRFLALCDRLGLLVFADAAAAYEYSDVALSRTVAGMTELVQRDRGHPCLIGWVPFNESWGLPALPTDAAQQEAVVALTSLVRALDPGRLVIGNDGWEFVAGDLVGVHDYAQRGEVLRARYGTEAAARRTVDSERPGNRVVVIAGSEQRAAGIPVFLSEFGGLSVHTTDDAWGGYGEVLTAEELCRSIADLTSGLGESSGIAGYCYTQLTDTVQEMNGLLTEHRDPKCAPEDIRLAFRGKA
jgi:beta-galactosidase/beta-glucuronidase